MKMRYFLLLGLGVLFYTPFAWGTASDDLVRSAGLTDPHGEKGVVSPAGRDALVQKLKGVLTLDDCVKLALANSPKQVTANLTVEEANIQVNLAKSAFLPTATVGASQQYTVQNPKGLASFDYGTSNVYGAAELSISAISEKVRAVKIQHLALEQAQLARTNQTNDIVRNVRKAYYALLAAQHTVDIRQKSRDLYKEQYDRVSEFFRLGLRPKVDVTTAEVNLNNEQLRLIRAKNAVKTASANLANVMGVTTPNVLKIEDISSFEKVDISFDKAVKTAYENRPDVQSAATDAKIGQIKLNQAKAGFFPTFSFSAGFRKYGDDLYMDNEETKLMASVELPIFNAFKTYNGYKQAKVSLAKTLNNNRSLLNNVFLEVQNAYINMQEALQSIPIAVLTAEKAQENLDLAQGRYNEGIGDIIELKDAEVAYTDAQLSLLTARYDYAAAVADLKQAMGTN